MNIQPRKSLGQHFLIDENIARKIIKCCSPSTKNILEIGAGTGVLSKYLIKNKNFNPRFIETDSKAIEILKEKYPSVTEKIIHENFLTFNPEKTFPDGFSVIGNFPYNIASQIFFKLLDHRNLVKEIICMVQKEFADRITAMTNSKTYGILSVLLQAYYSVEYCFTVSKNVFYPKPKVQSAVIKLMRNDQRYLYCDEQLFFQVVKTAFNQRRKMLRNALKKFGNIESISNYADKRAEQLSVSDFVLLTNEIATISSNK